MAPSGRPMYYKQSVIQVEQGEEESDVGPAAPSQSLTGYLALAPTAERLAVLPRHGQSCHILPTLEEHAEHCNFQLGDQSRPEQTLHLCAWSAAGDLLAVTSDAGEIFILGRDGRERLVFKHARWRQARIVSTFFSSKDVLYVLTEDASLWSANVQDSCVTEVLSDKVHIGTPSCSAYDAATGILCIAGRASNSKGEPHVSLWRIKLGTKPVMLAQHGRPAKQPWMRPARRRAERWSACINSESKIVLVATINQPLYIFTWQDDRKALQMLQMRPYPGRTPEWAQNVRQAVLWDSSHMAVLGSQGTLTVFDTASLEPRLQVPGCKPDAILASAVADVGAPGRVFMLSSTCSEDDAEASPGGSRGWQVEAVTEKSAAEQLAELTKAHDWAAALALAELHGLPADQVYKARFGSREVTDDSMRKDLDLLVDRAWAAERGTSCLAADSAAQAAVLEYSLAETDRWVRLPGQGGCDGDVSTSYADSSGLPHPGGDPWWRRQRLHLLQHMERLNTYLDLHGGAFDHAGYAEFRDCSLKDAAMEFASSGLTEAVKKLLQRHPYALMPHVLEILSCFPETLIPKSYIGILPKAAREGRLEAPQVASEPDWVESREVCQELQEAGEYAMLISTEHMAQLFIGWRPPTAHQVVQWFVQRAVEVDNRSGQLASAAALLRLCSKANAPQALTDALEAVNSLRDVAQSGEDGCWEIGLAAWASLDIAQRLRLLAAGASVERQRTQLAALLQRVPSASQRQRLLLELLEHSAPQRLQWCAEFLRLEAQHPQVFQSGGGIAEAACAAAYACAEDADWDLVQGMLAAACASQANSGAPDSKDWDGWQDADEEVEKSGGPDAKKELDEALSLVAAAKLLKDLGSPMTLVQLRDADAAAQRSIVLTLLARLARSQPPLSDQRWTEVWRQLRELPQIALSAVSASDLLGRFCVALLRCARWRLAQKYLAGTASAALEPAAAEALVLEISKEYFFSASSLQSPEVAQAQACLDVLPNSVAAAAERAFIKGVLRLQDFGVQIPPLQCCQVADRMELVQMALDARPGAHADGGRLALLADLLGVAERHCELLLRRARAALRAGDAAAAKEHALDLAAQGFAPAWDVAAQVISLQATRDDASEEMQALLTFCLAHCPRDQVQEHLDRWKRLRQLSRLLKSQDAVKSLLLKTIKNAGSQDTALLPDVGDAALVLACLLALEPGVDIDDAQLMRGLPFATSRSVLLLCMFASSLQALSPEGLPAESIAAAVAAARERLQCSPWEACSRAAALDPARLSAQRSAARQRSLEVRSRLTAAADERGVRSLLPPAAVPLFTAQASPEQRQAALLQAVTSAAGKGPMAAARQGLQQALVLAERYRLSTWHLQMRHAEALLLGLHPEKDVREAFEAVKADLLKEPRAALHALVMHVWPKAGPAASWQLSLLLSFLQDCLTALDADKARSQHMAAAKEFLQRCARTAPAMKAKVFIAPLLAAAVAGIDGSLSMHIVFAAEAEDHARQGVPGESEPEDAPQEAPRAAERPPLKRMLFAADSARADAGQLLQGWQGAALQEICAQVTPENAVKLAALIRSLPNLAALLQQSLSAAPEQPDAAREPGVRHSTVLLALLCKQMSCRGAKGDRVELSEGGVNASTELQQAWRTSRVHLKQLEPGHLAAFLRFLLMCGRQPLPSCGLPAGAAPLPDPLRLEVAQDGIATLEAALSKGAKAAAREDKQHSAAQPSQVELQDVRALLEELRRDAQALGLLTRLREQAGLSDAQLHVVQRSLGQHEGASNPNGPGREAALPGTLAGLVLTGCTAAKLLSVAKAVLEDSSSPAASKGERKGLQASQLVQRAVVGVVEGSLGELRRGTDSADTQTRDAMRALESAVQCLEPPVDPGVLQGGETAAAWQQRLRQEVWTQLLGFVLDAEQAVSSVFPCVLGLVGSIAAGALHPSRWQGWQPEGEDSPQLQQLLLLSSTQASLAVDFPRAAIRAADVADLPAVEALFMCLLDDARSQQQLLCLHKLLGRVWRSGAVFSGAGEPESAEEQPGNAGAADALENGDAHSSSKRGQGGKTTDVAIDTGDRAGGEGWQGADELDVALNDGVQPEGVGEGGNRSLEDPALVEENGWEEEDPLELESGSIAKAPANVSSHKEDIRMHQSLSGTSLADALPLHACWAALLSHMLRVGGRVLVATVLRTVEEAAAQKPFLITLEEARALIEAASSAGKDVAVTLGLLLPFPELQGTSEAQLRASGDLSASPDDSLIAVLLSRRLWPSMAQTPSYPRLAQALLKRTAFLPGAGGAGEESSGGGQQGSATAALAPSAAASLSESGRHAAAAAIAAAHLGLHPAMSTLGGGVSALGPYLRGSARAVATAAAPLPDDDAGDVSVPQALAQVWGMLSGQCKRALSRLQQDAP